MSISYILSLNYLWDKNIILMIQEKLNKLRPFVTGIRFIKNLPVVDLILKEGWNIFESDNSNL